MFSEQGALAIYVADGATKESIDEAAAIAMEFLVEHEGDLHVHSAAVSVDLAKGALTIELCGMGTSVAGAWLAVTTAFDRALAAAAGALRDENGTPLEAPTRTDLRVVHS